MENNLLIVCRIEGKQIDLLVPETITAEKLVNIINETIRPAKKYQFIRSDNPPRLLTGNVPINKLGLHHGSVLYL